MQPELLMFYKLIVLYILDRVDFPMSNTQITKIITEKEYTNYFTVQQVLAQLTDDGFINDQKTRNQTLYKINELGKETLNFFYKDLNKEIRDDIDIYLTEEKYALRNEVSCYADFFQNSPDEYIAELKIIERDSPVIELKVSVPTKQAAEIICDKWKQKNADIYAYVFNTLLNDSQ
ncbi:MAG: DUF4364 family protein [Clostridiales bacterium]|nr:DUF4364 family protein [Clostridiales bacterium]